MNCDPYYPIVTESLPEGWTSEFVGDVADVKPGFPSGRHNDDGLGIPHLRPMNIDRLGRIDLSDLKFVPSDAGAARMSEGDVLFNNTNSPALVGKTAFFNSLGEFGFSNHMTRVAPHDRIDARFLAYQLHYLWMAGYFRHHCINHVNQASIASRTLAEAVPVVFPKIGEQRRVVAVTEQLLERVNSVESSLTRFGLRLDKLAKATARSLIDRSWPTAALNDVCHLYQPKTIPIRQLVPDGAYPVFGANGVIGRYSAYNHADSEVLVTCRGATCGTINVSEPFSWVTGNAMVVRPRDDRVLREFLRYTLGLADLSKAISGSAQPQITRATLGPVRIVLPPLAEQREIVLMLEEQTVLSAHLAATVSATIRAIQKLRTSILHAAFSGRLLPRGPELESHLQEVV